jgi:hypothetical protein
MEDKKMRERDGREEKKEGLEEKEVWAVGKEKMEGWKGSRREKRERRVYF